MAIQTELSPNVPDITPDYVDQKPAAETQADRQEPAAEESPAPEYVDMECVHTLNAETLPPEAAEGEAPAAPEQPEVETVTESVTSSDLSIPLPKAETASHREGENIPNTPDIAPEFINENDTRPLPPSPEKEAAPDPAKTAPDPAKTAPAWMRWSYAATALVVAAFGILVCSQAISSLALAATLPSWAQFLLLVPLSFCCLTVAVVCYSLIKAWLRLREVHQVDIAALEELRRRAQTRKDGVEHFQAARRELEAYLTSYPLDADGMGNLRDSGLAPEHIVSLVKEREYLMERVTDSRSWLGEFREHFQGGLDKAASARIRSWSLKAAGCVIASPLPLLDAALVLGICLKMIKELCHIYNVRTSRSATLVLLNRAVLAAFVAGVADDAAGMAADMAGEDLAGVLGESAIGALGAGVARVVAPKLGEGAINAFFVMRLGRATMRLLQPLRS